MTKVHRHSFQAVDKDYEIIQVRVGGGRAYGFRRVEGQGIRLEDLPRGAPDLYENLLRETRKLLHELEEAGRDG